MLLLASSTSRKQTDTRETPFFIHYRLSITRPQQPLPKIPRSRCKTPSRSMPRQNIPPLCTRGERGSLLDYSSSDARPPKKPDISGIPSILTCAGYPFLLLTLPRSLSPPLIPGVPSTPASAIPSLRPQDIPPCINRFLSPRDARINHRSSYENELAKASICHLRVTSTCPHLSYRIHERDTRRKVSRRLSVNPGL